MIGRAAAALALGELDVDAALDGAEIKGERVPLVEIPTSLRHPFLTQDCILLPDGRDRRHRLARFPDRRPPVALVDPGLSASLSPKLSASCVIDSLLGTVEAYVSAKSSFMSDSSSKKRRSRFPCPQRPHREARRSRRLGPKGGRAPSCPLSARA